MSEKRPQRGGIKKGDKRDGWRRPTEATIQANGGERFVSKRRDCSGCGREFDTTRERRMLCAFCFKGNSARLNEMAVPHRALW